MLGRGMLTVLLAAVAAMSPRIAFAGDFDEARKAARADVVVRLADLAEWAATGQLWLQRSRLAAAILRFDPDHAKARQWLKYEKSGPGWKQVPGWTEPKDVANAKALPEFLKRRADVAAAFRNRLFEAIEREGAALPPVARERAIEDVLAVWPDDPVARDANGEVERGTGWVLKETIAAPARRAELVAQAKAALAAVPTPEAVALDPAEAALAGGWDAMLSTAHFRVGGRKQSAELPKIARIAEASVPLFSAAIGVLQDSLLGFTMLLFPKRAEGLAFILGSKAFPEGPRALATKCSAFWIPEQRKVLIYPDDPTTREEWAARQPIGDFLHWNFNVSLKKGWAQEGFGVYLSFLLTGHHRTFFVQQSDYGANADPFAVELWKRLQLPETDWMDEARGVLPRWPKGDLRLLLGKDVNIMKGDDLVVSYALAAFLLEGHKPQVVPLLTAIGRGLPVDDVVSRALRLSVDGLEAKLRRFVEERKKP